MLRITTVQSRPTVLASAVLALALLGDSLLYAALPVSATTFGVSVGWVGVLLSANRITRLFVYPLLPRAAGTAGLRGLTIGGATLGAMSTLWFAIASGPLPLLAARIVWGAVFGALSLAALAYAVETAEGSGARVGLSLSLRELGPIASLTAGMLLVTRTGLRPALLVLGAISLLAIPLALALPPSDRRSGAHAERCAPAGVTRHELLSGTVGFVADGLFPATIAVLLIEPLRASTAVLAAGTILAFKRAGVFVLGPIHGRLADRAGAAATSRLGLAIGATGTILISKGYVVGGAIVLICGTAATSVSIPLLASDDNPKKRLAALARLGLARDVGAAAGPLVALPLLEAIGGSLLYAAAAAALFAAVLGVGERSSELSPDHSRSEENA